jgi:hypothetical protein
MDFFKSQKLKAQWWSMAGFMYALTLLQDASRMLQVFFKYATTII